MFSRTAERTVLPLFGVSSELPISDSQTDHTLRRTHTHFARRRAKTAEGAGIMVSV